MKDISEEEELLIPLPENWIRLMRSDSTSYYRNILSGAETDEHPYILNASNIARKMKLPPEWKVKEVELDDGTIDYFYFNAEDGISLWDPPFLRSCLADVLGADGHSAAALWILSEDLPVPKDSPKSKEESFGKIFADESNLQAPVAIEVKYEPGTPIIELEQEDTDFPLSANNSIAEISRGENVPAFNPSDHMFSPAAEFVDEDQHYADEYNNYTNGFVDYYSKGGDGSLDADELYVDITVESFQNCDISSKSIRECKAPRTAAGVRILSEDCKSANFRVHELLVRLRSALCMQCGIPVGITDYSSAFSEMSGTNMNNAYSAVDLLNMASNILQTLKNNPQIIVSSLVGVFPEDTHGRFYQAYLTLHRLFHPYSSDNSMTTYVILESINVLINELSNMKSTIESLRMDESEFEACLPCLLFISDISIAQRWNPLAQPLPVPPNINNETILSCLLRVFGIRRDVTSYFRTIWRPSLPSIVAVFQSNDPIGRHTFSNLVLISFRLLELTFRDDSIVGFPATATAVCRSLHTIAGMNAVHHYVLNYLLLPNLLKILLGDHESIENEIPFRKDSLPQMVNSYFDLDEWWPSEGMSNSPYHPVNSWIWIVWRMYSAAAFLDMTTLETITTDGLFYGGPKLDYKGVPDIRSRNLILRLKRKMDHCYRILLKLPVDSLASQFLGEEVRQDEGWKTLETLEKGKKLREKKLSSSKEDNKKANGKISHQHKGENRPQEEFVIVDEEAGSSHLREFRLMTLLIKPEELLNYVIISRSEVAIFFHNIGVYLEMTGEAAESDLYRSISEYLVANESLPEHFGVEFLVISFPNTTTSTSSNYSSLLPTERIGNEEFLVINDPASSSSSSSSEVKWKYDQLARGLRIASRYENSLLRMLDVVEHQASNLLEDALEQKLWYLAPEFDANYQVHDVDLFNKHTMASKPRHRPPLHGLLHPRGQIQMDSSFSSSSVNHGVGSNPDIPVIPDLEQQSLKSLQDLILKSFRFHSSSSSAAVGTSLARSVVQPPIVSSNPASFSSSSIAVSSLGTVPTNESFSSARHKSIVRPRFTRVTVPNSCGFLVDTESSRHAAKQRLRDSDIKGQVGLKSKLNSMPNYTQRNHDSNSLNEELDEENWKPRSDRTKKFLTSLRSHDVIPAEKFRKNRDRNIRMVRQNPYWNRYNTAISSPNGSNGSLSSPKKSNGFRQPQPFPEHLRNRVRETPFPVWNGDIANPMSSYVEAQPRDNSDWQPGSHENDGWNERNPYPEEEFEEDYIYEDMDGIDDEDEDDDGDGHVVGDGEDVDDDNAKGTDLSGIQEIIHNYHQIFGARESISPLISHSSSPFSNGTRSRSPHLPTPTYQAKFFAPTQSLLHRFNEIQNAQFIESKVMNDKAIGAPPNLRNRDLPLEQQGVSHPFIPSGILKSPKTSRDGIYGPSNRDGGDESVGDHYSRYSSIESSSRASSIRRSSRERSKSHQRPQYHSADSTFRGEESNLSREPSSLPFDYPHHHVDSSVFRNDHRNEYHPSDHNFHNNNNYDNNNHHHQQLSRQPYQPTLSVSNARQSTTSSVLQDDIYQHHEDQHMTPFQFYGNQNEMIGNDGYYSTGPRDQLPLPHDYFEHGDDLNNEIEDENENENENSPYDERAYHEDEDLGYNDDYEQVPFEESTKERDEEVMFGRYNDDDYDDDNDDKIAGDPVDPDPEHVHLNDHLSEESHFSNDIDNDTYHRPDLTTSSRMSINSMEAPFASIYSQEDTITSQDIHSFSGSVTSQCNISQDNASGTSTSNNNNNNNNNNNSHSYDTSNNYLYSKNPSSNTTPASSAGMKGEGLNNIPINIPFQKVEVDQSEETKDDNNNNDNIDHNNDDHDQPNERSPDLASSPIDEQYNEDSNRLLTDSSGGSKDMESNSGGLPSFRRRSLWGRDELVDEIVRGIVVTKHGKSGFPKKKILKFDPQSLTLTWTTVKRGSIAEMLTLHSKSRYTSSFAINDIVEIRKGIQTETLRKAKSLDPGCCLSVVTKDRSLDLTMKTSTDRDMVVRSIAAMLEKNNYRVPIK